MMIYENFYPRFNFFFFLILILILEDKEMQDAIVVLGLLIYRLSFDEVFCLGNFVDVNLLFVT